MTRISFITISLLALACCAGCVVVPQSSVPSHTPTITPIITKPMFPATHTPAPSPTPDTRFELSKIKAQEVNFWHPWTGAKGKTLAQLVQEFNSSNEYGISVNLTAWGGMVDLQNGLNNTKEDLPNIVVLAPEKIQNQIETDSFLDLVPYIQKDDSEINSGILTDLPENLVNPVKVGSQVFGLPASIDTPILIYNKTWGNELGFSEPPTTWEEFKNQLCTAAQTNNKSSDRRKRGTGGWLEDYSILVDLGWLQAQGGDLPFSTSATETLDNPQIEQAFTDLKDLSASGCSWQGRNPSPTTYFIERKALIISIPAGKVQAFKIGMETAKSKDEWSVLSFPEKSGEASWIPSVGYYSILPSDNNNINLAAWLVLRWLTDSTTENRLSLSDGSLPASKTGWKSVQAAGTLPTQLSSWMALAGEPAVPPYFTTWNYAQEILQDGFHQIYQTDITTDEIPGIITNMDNLMEELERHYNE